MRARRRFYNLVDLINQLEQQKAAGRSGQLTGKLLRYDLIVIWKRIDTLLTRLKTTIKKTDQGGVPSVS